MTKIETLIKGAIVHTLDRGRTWFPDGAVAIDSGRILAVGPTSALEQAFDAERIVNAPRRLLLPGFINTHFHAALNFDRPFSLPESKTETYAEEAESVIERRAPHLLSTAARQPNGLNLARFFSLAPLADRIPQTLTTALAAHSLMVQLRAGTTCFVEGGGGPTDGVISAAQKLGMRAGVGHLCYDLLVTPGQEQLGAQRVADVERVLDAAHATVKTIRSLADSRITPWFNLLSDVVSSDELCAAVAESAIREGLRVQSHTAAAAAQEDLSLHCFRERGIARAHRLGLLNSRFVGIHMGFADPEHVQLVRQAGASVVHCVGTSMLTGKGIVSRRTIIEYLQAGVNVALGSDTAHYGTMIDEVRRAYAVHKDVWGDDRTLPAYRVLRMATLDAAECIGMQSDLGSIEMGKQADLVLLDLDQPQYVGIDPIVAIALYGESADIDSVMIRGEWVLKNRQWVAIDPAEINAKLVEAVNAILLLIRR
jgi:cytosine/adenosine deaminase-related metal-dependent hydrolase